MRLSGTSTWTGTIRRVPRTGPLGPLGLALAAALLGLLLLPPVIPYEPVWEVAAALGYAACLAAILSFRIAPSPRAAATNPYRLALHRAAGYAMLALVALHVAVMLLGDPFVLDYVGWMMPLHVLAGVLAALALPLAVATREPPLRTALRLARWPRLHLWAGLAAAGLAGVHVVASAGKLAAGWRYALLAGIFTVLLGPASVSLAQGPRRWLRPRRAAARTGGAPAAAGPGDVALLLAGLTAATLLLFAVPALVRLVRG
jgi:hypothetical protein